MRPTLSEERAQFSEHVRRILEDVCIGVAAMPVAAGVRLTLPTAVLLPGVARVVVAVAVELDREAVGGPAAVDALGARGLVRDRSRQAGFAQERQEAVLQFTEGDGDVAVQDGAQGFRDAG